MVLLLLFRDTTDIKNVPKWRNWQTHLTQNQAGNRAGSSPASGIAKKDLQKRTLMQIFFIVFPSKKQLLKERKPLSKNRPSAAWFFLKGVLLLLFLIYFQTSSHTPVFHPV